MSGSEPVVAVDAVEDIRAPVVSSVHVSRVTAPAGRRPAVRCPRRRARGCRFRALPVRPGTRAGVGGSIGRRGGDAAAGSDTVRIAARTIHRGEIATLRSASSRSPSRRADVGISSGIEANRSRYAGQAGISSRQNVLDSMSARGEKPLTTRKAASQPPSSAAIAPRRTRRTAMSPAIGAHCASRALQKNSRN